MLIYLSSYPEINFSKNGKFSLVEFIYPWLPARCHTCGKWGHIAKACVMNKKDRVGWADQKVEIKKQDDLEKSVSGTANTVVQNLEQEAESEQVIPSHTMVNEEEGNTQNNEEEIEEGQIIGEWSNVSPAKMSRSPKEKTLEYG